MKTLKIESIRGGVLRLTLSVDGVVKDYDQGRFGGRRAVESAARRFGTEPLALQQLLDQGEGEYELPCAEVTVATTVLAPLPVFCRGLNETQDKAQEYESLEACLADVHIQSAEPVISWDGTDRLCAVDADFHSLPLNSRPSEQVLERRMGAVHPTPRYSWVTHGRGIRLIYERMGIYDANELAAVAAVRLTTLEPLCSVELKAGTRHPLYERNGLACGPVQRGTQTTDLSAISGWHEGRQIISNEAVEEWLEERGYKIGERYGHDRCPVSPGEESHGTPVCVNRDGVYCFKCNASGVRRGSRVEGWFPYTALVGERAPSSIAGMVGNFTHWEHARYVLGAHHSGLSEAVLRGAYGALLKSKWGDDPRLPTVFGAGRDVVRFNNRWATLRGETWQASRHTDAILSELPGCKRPPNEDGECLLDRARLARLAQPVDLSDYGYPHLNPVFGLPIYSQFNEARYPYELRLCKCPGPAPKYVPENQRDIRTAWDRLEQAFPGVNRNAVRVLLAAKGFAEGDTTFPPFLFITGPTASAKSTTCMVAASIAGDSVVSVPMVGTDERLRQAIFGAKNTGTYCAFDEAGKGERGNKLGKAESMEYALSLVPSSTSHHMYVGPVMLGALPVMVWTDVEIPLEVRQHAQLARRFIHIRLAGEVDWHKSMRETGLGKAEWLRQGGAPYVDACDAILSEVIDDFFKPCVMTFEQVANDLGFKTLKQSEAAQYMRKDLLAFYDAVMAAPKDGDGWVEFDILSNDSLAKQWKTLADAPNYRGSQRCSEVDWSALLGVAGPVRLETNGYGTKLRLRFDGSIPQIRSGPNSTGRESRDVDGEAELPGLRDLPMCGNG